MKNDEAPTDLNEFFKLSKDLMVIAANGYFKFVAPSCLSILGYTQSEMMAQPYVNFIHPEDTKRTQVEVDRMIKKKVKAEEFTNRYLKKDGSIVWLEWKVTVQGETTYAVGRDITDKKTKHDAYHQAQEQLNLALESARLGTWYVNLDTQKINLSEIAKKIYDMDSVEDIYVEDFISKYVHPEDQEAAYQKWNESIEDNKNYYSEFRIIRSSGEVRWILAMGKSYSNDEGKTTSILGIVTDITTRKKKEEHIRMLATLVENSYELIFVIGLDLKTLFLNPAATKLLGINNLNQELFLTDYIPVEFHAKIYKEVLPQVRDKGVWQGELALIDFSNKEIIPVSFTIFPISLTNISGAFSYGMIAHDIRNIKKQELEQMRDHKRLEALAIDLRSALEARDTFISIASHELKTPLTSLKLQSQLSKKLVERVGINNMPPDQIQKLVEAPLTQANKLIKLINDILDISVINAGKLIIKRIPTNLSVLLQENLDSFKQQIEKSKNTLTLDIEPEVVGDWDAYRIDQVVSNLISNALKYAPGKPLFVSLKQANNEAILTVKDEGPGIHKDTQSKIFKRFERGVPASGVSGLGLGLYLAKQIVEGHDGEISVISEPEHGSEFIVRLPLYKRGKVTASQILAETKKNLDR